MWSNLMYFLPVAAILSSYTIECDVHLEGDLGEELEKLFGTYISSERLRITTSPSLKARVNMTYPAKTNLWTIFDSIMQRFHLAPEVSAGEDRCVVVVLREGSAWTR